MKGENILLFAPRNQITPICFETKQNGIDPATLNQNTVPLQLPPIGSNHQLDLVKNLLVILVKFLVGCLGGNACVRKGKE